MNYLSPLFNAPVLNTDVTFLTGGKLYTYEAGTSTPLATYTTQTGSTPHDNPIILNARGLPNNGNPIWLASGREYKFILKDSNDVTIAPTYDDVGGLNDLSAEQSEWQTTTLVPTYISTTSFSVPGDRTATLLVGRRIKTTNTGGAVYSTITSSSYGANITTVVVSNDSGTLDSGISAVAYGVVSPTNTSLPRSQHVRQTMGLGYGADIASAATVDLSTRTGEIVRITGTVATTAVTLANGDTAWCYAVGAWPLTYHATNLPLPGGASYTCSAGDIVKFTKDGNGTISVEIVKKDGTAVVTTNYVQIQPISASVGSNALTISASSLTLDFRSTTLGSGTVTRVTGTPANLVISSGSTLGTTSAVQSDIAVLAINNAGTIELAAVNVAGGTDLTETGLISTTAEGGAGAADSVSTVYSTTARTNVAYRVIGFIRSTQATAGTWATAPSLEQGAGGQALDLLKPTSGLVKLNSGSVSSAATLDIVLRSYISRYSNFKIVITDLAPATDIVAFYGRLSTNGGSSYDSGASDYGNVRFGGNTGGTSYAGQEAASEMRFTAAAVGNLSTEGIRRFEANLSNVNDTAGYTDVDFSCTFVDNTGAISKIQGACMRAAAQDTDAIRFLFSSGNISTANWVLSGWN